MAEPLKNLYSLEFYSSFCNEVETFIPSFDQDLFINQIFDDEWENRELKERLHHTTEVLYHFMPSDQIESIKILVQLSHHLLSIGHSKYSLEYMFLPDYFEMYCIDFFDESMTAFEQITPLTSCEFAIRPFILKNMDASINYLIKWTAHKNEHVRRLASEGCRPRLPWAIALPPLKEDPNPILPILEQLIQDESEYVRKSVANNFNDISKDNPEILINILKKWENKSSDTTWILKHASRTLLKQGQKDVMHFFGFKSSKQIKVANLKIQKREIKLGEHLEFGFKLENTSNSSSLIRLEYAIYYMKSNGIHSKKVFKISEKDYPSKSKTLIERSQHFKAISTRRYYEGIHYLSIIINGEEKEKHAFTLNMG